MTREAKYFIEEFEHNCWFCAGLTSQRLEVETRDPDRADWIYHSPTLFVCDACRYAIDATAVGRL